MEKYDAIIFDLDDTLLDTSTHLIGPAITGACKAMIELGLAGDLSDCVHHYYEFSEENLRRDFFSFVVPRLGLREANADMRMISQIGRDRFYQAQLPPTLEPIPGTRELLEKLAQSYSLFLVSAGHRTTQEGKVALLNISRYFQSLIYVDPQKNESKQQAFVQIQSQWHLESQRVLCVGNRLDNEIQAANHLGFDTCYVRFGEHGKQRPIQDIEKPSYTVDHILQIVKVCQL